MQLCTGQTHFDKLVLLVFDKLHTSQCHTQGWVPRLERKLEIASESAHPDFRCFFSAEPINGAPFANIVPEAILQVRSNRCLLTADSCGCWCRSGACPM